MAKVMLVEDDNNLREIYEARLAAEGYEIVSAHDGEEALALAVKEQPDLIISDIMMPKISGFDMLDILRSTPETKDTKVIMMTALSQIEDKERADKLGADRYLVKSQVTLEDVVRVAKELLGQTESQANSIASAAAGTTPDPSTTATTDSTMTMATPPTDDIDDSATPASVTEEPVSDTPVVPDEATVTPEVAETESAAIEPEPAAPVAETPEPVETPATSVPEPVDAPDTGSTDDPDEPVTAAPATVPVDTPVPTANVEDQIRDFISTAEQVKNNANTPAPTPATAPTQIPVTSADEPAEPAQPQLATPSGQKKVIAPINDLSSPGPDLDALLAKEESKPADTTTPVPSINTVISPDGTLSYATPPPADAAPTGSVPEEKASDIAQPPHQPGQKIDPDNIAL